MQKHPGQTRNILHKNSALFLDIDGTLLEIAATPTSVVVPRDLVALLLRLTKWLGGAIALVSGRPIAQVDALFAPLKLTCAGEHGAVLRLPDGVMEQPEVAKGIPEIWRSRIARLTRDMEGVLVEPKTYGVAVHYRLAPRYEEDLREGLARIVAQNTRDFEMLPAAMAFEIRNRAMTKAAPVLRLMSLPPFKGRTPVFIGDDVTDHDGFRAVTSLGGHALDVHADFDGKPSEVRRWLEDAAPREAL